MSRAERLAMIDRGDGPSVRRQCALLGLARSGVYRKPPSAYAPASHRGPPGSGLSVLPLSLAAWWS